MTDAPPPATPVGNTDRVPPWPAGTTVQQLAFVAERPADLRVVCELPAPLNRRAVALPLGTKQAAELELLSIPSDSPEDAELAARLREWVAAGATTAQMITFQGTLLFWGTGRAAVIAPAERLVALETVLAELAYYEGELHDVERQLGAAWPDLEADGGPAFEFDERSAKQRDRLAKRFRQLLGLRARLTRVLPFVLTPHVYPPTLASQVSERLRERLRMRHRVEMIQEQLEVFERIYDTCAQRASDYRANRKNHLLEMVIIVLLAAQTLLVLFEVLTHAKATATTPATTPTTPAGK